MTGREVITFSTKKEYAAQYLRELVISGALRSGARVMQQDIAGELGISVTPVREAIRQLETEGYLESTAHVGVRVAHIHRDGLDEIYHLRQQLEGDLAAEAARRVTDDQLEKIHSHLKDFERAIRKGDRIASRLANYRFHVAIWEIADRPVTFELVNSLWAKVPWDSLEDTRHRGRSSVEEHRRQIQALEARDPEASREAQRSHIGSARQYLADRDAADGAGG